jgi:hypothetical protein
MGLPLSGLEEWLGPSASPWLIVNKFMRIYEGMAERASIEDRDLTEAPATCNNGARFLVAGPTTLDDPWDNHEGELAIALGTNAASGWYFIPVEREGFELYVRDEDVKLIYLDPGGWTPVAVGTVSADEVNYTPSEEGFYAGTVEEALDQLFAMVESLEAWQIAYVSDDEGFYGETVEQALDEIIGSIRTIEERLSTISGGGSSPPITDIESASVATQQTTTSTSYTDLATAGPAVTLNTGTDVIVTISCGHFNNAAGTITSYSAVAVSGATTLAAADGNAAAVSDNRNGFSQQVARRFKMTGLTPGSNTFTLKYKSSSGSSVGFVNRDITVEAL